MKPYTIIRVAGVLAAGSYFVNFFTGIFNPLLPPALILVHISTVVYFQLKRG
jgi:hypothetical protein